MTGTDRSRAAVLRRQVPTPPAGRRDAMAEPICDVVIFPLARKSGLIRKHARRLSGFSPQGAEGALEQALDRQVEWLLKMGLPSADAVAEVNAFERAIRAEMAELLSSSLQA
jgi:hypothetical protein